MWNLGKKKKEIKPIVKEVDEDEIGAEEEIPEIAPIKKAVVGKKIVQPTQSEPQEEEFIRIEVVKELPLVPVDKYIDKPTGKWVKLITIEEALTEMMNNAGTE